MNSGKRIWYTPVFLILFSLYSVIGKSQFSVDLAPFVVMCVDDCEAFQPTIIGGTPPFSFQWTTPAGVPISDDYIFTFCPADWGGAGYYSFILTVYDSDGYSGWAPLDIEVIYCNTVDPIIEGPAELCIGECGTYFALDAGGEQLCVISWWASDGTSSTNSVFEYCPTANGVTQIQLDAYNCNTMEVGQAYFEIVVTDAIPLEIVSTSPASCPENSSTSACDKTCANSTITYTVPGSQGLELEWEVLGAESYEVDNNLVTVNWGAPGTGEINVNSAPSTTGGTGNTNLHINVYPTFEDINNQGTGAMAAYGQGGVPPYTYFWDIGVSPGNYISNLYGNNNYGVTVTDALGNTASSYAFLPTADSCGSGPMSIGFVNNISVIHNLQPDCLPGPGTGSIDLTTTGGSPPYTFLWSNGATTEDISNLTTGYYTVTITDDENCIRWQDFSIGCVEESDCAPIYLNCYNSYPTPFDLPQGSGTVQVFGGTPPYTYAWDNGETTSTATSLSIGFHTVVVTDANGCGASCEIYVHYFSSAGCFDASWVFIDEMPSDCNAANGSLTANVVNNGAAQLEFEWSTGATTSTISNLSAGTYFVTITDLISGCQTERHATLHCSETNTCAGIGSLCIDIIEEPQAQFSTSPADVNGVIEICRGETVTFSNESNNAENYVWELGDGYATSAPDVSHAYTESGLYDVLLIARNECFCIDTTSIKVLVSDAEIPEIVCRGTVCENETQVYSTTADCSNFIWTVSPNGTVSAGGGPSDNFVEVDWGDGPEGEVSLQVSSCNGNYCDNPTVIKIPIITDGVLIEGPAYVCPGEVSTYSIPQWSATEYNWSSSIYGEIKSGQGTNTITVKWNVESNILQQQWVHVEYNNCFLECGGESTKDVFITPDFYLAGSIQVCENTVSEYAAFNEFTEVAVPCHWAVLNTSNDSTLWASSTPSASTDIDWSMPPGKYLLTANAVDVAGFCSPDYSVLITVTPAPPSVNSISGQNSICPGEYYTYYANSTTPNVSFQWTINNGGLISEKTGDVINVQWGNTQPYELTVIQVSTAGLACESDPFTLSIQTISSISLDGPAATCIEATEQYTAPAIGNASYDWTITPENAGSVLTGQGSDTIDIIWHIEGMAQVQVSVCGATETLPVTVFGYPDPIVNYPDSLCADQTAAILLTDIYNSYTWKDEDGNTISTSGSPNLGPGYYEVIVTNSAGCEGQATFSIHSLPNPVINISTPSFQYFCEAAGHPIPTLYALNTEEGYSYEWFQNGNALGVFTDSYTPTSGGNFYIKVTDVNGCETNSNIITLTESCGGGGPPIPGTGCSGVSNTISTGPACLHGLFENTSTNYQPGTVSWNFGDPASGADNYSTLEAPEHFFSSAGFYNILMTVTMLDGAVCVYAQSFEVPVQADFDFVTSCPGLPVRFEDLSTFTPGSTVTNYEWDFGDPASGADNSSNLQHPEHVFNDIGTYTVNLTTTAQTGCTSTISRSVSVLPPPVASFQLPEISCAATALNFDVELSPDITSFEWNFGDPASGPANISRLENTFHSFSSAGPYDVQLKVFNIYACADSISLTVPITTNDLTGAIDISPGSPLCEGDQATITAPPGGTSWVWSPENDTESFTQYEAGIFEVTVSDDNGCSYSPPAAVLDIIAQPEATIKVTEYNEFGQPADCFFDGYILCEGEDVFLNITGAGDYSYTWSNGQNGDEVIYDDEHGGTLSAGDHEFEVTVTDNLTGCTSIEGPFTITVNPVPTDILIISSPAGAICEQTTAAFTVSNPDPQLTYLWSTGEYGNSITASTAGEYFVRGISAFGCEGESNIIEIFAAPDINLVPDGCHTRCSPDTLCLPNIPDVVSYQWYLDDVAIPAPEGTAADFVPTESGSYRVALTDTNGCDALSNPFDIDLLPLDTSSLQLGACEGGTVEYAGEVLTPGTVTEFYFTNQFGCDSMITVYVSEAVNYEENISLSACEGSSVVYGGQSYPAGTDTTLNLLTQLSCDSIININVTALPISNEVIQLSACSGTTVNFDGMDLAAGSTTEFSYTNQFDCDSNLTVIVMENMVYNDTVLLSGCAGGTVTYEGMDYPVGTNTSFNYSTIEGCDSTIHLIIDALPIYDLVENLSACAGTNLVLPGGLELAAGTDTTLFLSTLEGCDSTVQIIVESVEAFEIDVNLGACEGESVIYEGTEYPAGTDIEFNFMSSQGCDSTVHLMVATWPIQNETLQLAACTGTTIEYAGQELEPGTTTEFIFANQFGCDSTVNVSVLENQTYYEAVDIDGCEGETVIYDGTEYPVGSIQEINYTTVAGCDSIILLSVAALPLSTTDVELMACPGGFAEYNGEELPTGSVNEYLFVNQYGCDSLVEVTVSALPVQNETIELSGCDGQSIIYGGVEYPVGTQVVLTLVNQYGCDSVLNLNITPLSTFEENLTFEACPGESIEFDGQDLEVGSNTTFTYLTSEGCDSVLNVAVIAYPAFEFEVLPADIICWNSADGVIEINLPTGGTPPFTYSLDAVNYQSEPLWANLSDGDYTVYVQDANDCVEEQSLNIPSIPPLEVDFLAPTIGCEEDSILVQSFLLNGWTDSLIYEWQHGSNEPNTSVYNPGIYILDVTNLCETKSFEVEVELADDYRDQYIYIPNAFSPNFDGINDIFKAYPAAGITVLSYELHLFDRWGNTLYTTTDIDEGWDGVFLDEAMNPGVYVWWLKARVFSCRNEIEVFEKGDVTIMK